MERCWKLDPVDRPTFSEVHQTLSTLIEEQNSYNYISMTGIDLCPIECAQGEDEGSDQLESCCSKLLLTGNSVGIVEVNPVILEFEQED